jgi:hypothetical protein
MQERQRPDRAYAQHDRRIGRSGRGRRDHARRFRNVRGVHGGAGGGLDSYLRDLREALEGPRTLAPMAGNVEHTDVERDAPPIYRLPHRASTCSGRGLFTRVRGVQPSVLNRCTLPIGGYLRSRFTPFIWYKLTPYGVGSRHSRFVRSLVVRTWFSGAKDGGFS